MSKKLQSKTLLIGELFEKDPRRRIEPVVKVDEHDPNVVRVDFKEYVVTPDIKKDFANIIDRFITRGEIPESVCGWISGFFGSGKSHFLKILGYVLSNRPVELEKGTTIGAATYFCKRNSIPGSKVLEKELKTRSIFVNMLNFDREKGPSIMRIVHEALLREMDLSEVGWVSEVERTLKKKGLWEEFLGFVQTDQKEPWQEVRKNQVRVRPILARGLMKLDQANYTTIDIAMKSLDDVRESFTLNQSRLAQRLLEFAEDFLDPARGRVVVLLDEVSLYIGTDTDRMTDLYELAEEITRIGKGKVWLFVSGQEALEEKIPAIERKKGQFQTMKDRFQINVVLTPENINTVVKERLLQKTAEQGKLKVLGELFEKNSGTLEMAALMKNPSRDYGNLFTRLDHQRFVDSYPFMPYHVPLMQEIFGILRSRGGVPQTLTGRERAILVVVRAALSGVKGKSGLVDMPVGELATFDMIYDAIDEELKAVRSSQQADIERHIAQLGARAGLRVDSVAKSLFLLQQVSLWLPCTLDNLVAVMYPRLGTDKNELENAVRECLTALKNGKWVTEEEGNYRFLTEFERRFEDDVESKTVNESEKRDVAQAVLKQALRKFGSYDHLNIKSFNIHLTADGEEVTAKGDMKLSFYSPYGAAKQEDLIHSLIAKSPAEKDTIYWVCKTDDVFEEEIERTIRLDKTLKDWELKTPSEEEKKALQKRKREVDSKINDELPVRLRNAASSGKIVYLGEAKTLEGTRNMEDVFSSHMRAVVEDLYTEFHHAAFPVEKDEHTYSILTWQGGKLPKIYYDLKLVDDHGDILTDRPVASRVMDEVRLRSSQKQESQTGGEVSDHFERIPYGWDPRVVRVTLATLFKNNSVMVHLEGSDFASATVARSHEAFRNARSFNRARFTPGQEVSLEQRKLASQLISEIFGESTEGVSVEDVDKAICLAIESRLKECDYLLTIAEERKLPQETGLSDLASTMNKINSASDPSTRILEFIDKSNQSVLKTYVPVLDKLSGFESEGNLRTYYSIREFSSLACGELSKFSEKKEICAACQKLSQNIQAGDFIDRWPDIVGIYQALFGEYARLYTEIHSRSNQSVEEAAQSLKRHPAMATEEAKTRLKKLNDLACPIEEPGLRDNFLVCERCKASITDLFRQLEIIEARKRDIREELDILWNSLKKGRTDEIVGFVETIKSAQQIPNVTGKVKDVSEKAVSRGKTVKVRLEVE